MYIQTIKAMKKIADIRKRREDRFWNNRMKLAKVQKIRDIMGETERHAHLIEDQQVREQIQEQAQEKLRIKEENKGQRGKMTI